jgi:hypothetical protein
VACVYGCDGRFALDAPHFVQRDGCPARTQLRQRTEEALACAFCFDSHENRHAKHQFQQLQQLKKCPEENYAYPLHPAHQHFFQRASIYDCLEETFGWLFFHRDKLILFSAIMQLARNSSRDNARVSPILALPRDVLIVIFDLLVEAMANSKMGDLSCSHFVGFTFRKQAMPQQAYTLATSPPDLYYYLFNHRCLSLNPCPVPGCEQTFATTELLAKHFEHDCARYRFPCPACGHMLSRAEFAKHGPACPYQTMLVMVGMLPKLPDFCIKETTAYIAEAGKVKRVGEESSVICKDFSFPFDDEFMSHLSRTTVDDCLRSHQFDQVNVWMKEHGVKFEALAHLSKEFVGYNRKPV